MIKSNKNYEIFSKKHNQEIQKLTKILEESEKYFNYEEDRIKNQEEINKLNRLNEELNKEKQIIEK